TEADEYRNTHMRTPKDLASAALVSATEHTKRASTLRRLASGLRAQSTGELGLNDKERKVLMHISAHRGRRFRLNVDAISA
ncbi:MAG: hypothetical protein WBC08_07160, partial [Rhodoferax sp.]